MRSGGHSAMGPRQSASNVRIRRASMKPAAWKSCAVSWTSSRMRLVLRALVMGTLLRHRDGQGSFRYRTPAQPPRECAGHENPFHALTLSLSDTAWEGSLPYSTATNGGAV